MDQSWILLDSSTGLHVAWYFWLRVLDEVNRATRYGTPFALLLLEAGHDGSGVKTKRGGSDPTGLVPPAIRSTDLGGYISPSRAAVLLTHQDAESAEQAQERILGRLAAANGDIRWIPRLLTFPDEAAEISTLLTRGWEAEAGAAAEVKLTA
jgi:hypothetical protein